MRFPPARRLIESLGLAVALAASAGMPAFAQTEALDRATCHTATGQAAIDACTRLLDANTATGHARAVLLNDRGLLFFNTGNIERAQADFDEAVKVAADLAPAWYNRGLLGARLGHFDQAIADFTRAGELAPQRAIIWQSRGGAYSRKGDDSRAIEDYSRAIELDPKLAISWASRGLTRARNGDLDQAVADLTQALKLEPGNATYVEYLRQVEAARKK